MDAKQAILEPRYNVYVGPTEQNHIRTVHEILQRFVSDLLDKMVEEGVVTGDYKFEIKARHKDIPGL